MEKSAPRPFCIAGERGTVIALPNFWSPPVGEKGLLTVIVDYNNPAKSFIQHRVYWNGDLVADYETNGSKGNTSSDTNALSSPMTLFNSAQGHVPFEGLLFDFLLGSSTGEISEADLSDVHDWYMNYYGIA